MPKAEAAATDPSFTASNHDHRVPVPGRWLISSGS